MEDQDYSNDMFRVGDSGEVRVQHLHLFNERTEIIKPGQRHKVIYGQMEEESRPLHVIVAPYLLKFAVNTKDVAATVGSAAYAVLKEGFLWIYNHLVGTVLPYAVETLPKILFVAKKEEKPFNINSSSFEVLGIDQNDYDLIRNQQQAGKTRVVIPLGTDNDQHFEAYLRDEKYEINYSYPIDLDSEDQFQVKQSFMIPSESFEVICEGVKESYAQLQLDTGNTRKVAYKLQNCFIFELEGQNSNEFDMLDEIEKNEHTKVGYIVVPEQTLRRSMEVEVKVEVEDEEDPIAQLVSGKEAKAKIEEEHEQKQLQERAVDRERKVRVEINPPTKKAEAELLLN